MQFQIDGSMIVAALGAVAIIIGEVIRIRNSDRDKEQSNQELEKIRKAAESLAGGIGRLHTSVEDCERNTKNLIESTDRDIHGRLNNLQTAITNQQDLTDKKVDGINSGLIDLIRNLP